MITVVVLVLLFALLAIGVPVGLCMAVSGAIGLYLLGGMTVLSGILSTAPLSAVGTYEFVAVPMFLLMAEFIVVSRIADDLFRSAATWLGRTRGGLGIATALAGAGFGAISGSSTASAATLSATTIPVMLEKGYLPKMACGIVAISGTLAMLIPPSIALILYGIIADVGIGKLLVGGVIPGLLVTLTIIATILFLIWREPDAAPRDRRYTMKEKIYSLKVVGPMLVLIMAVTGVIYLGVATPTEASGIGAVGALCLSLRARRMSWKILCAALTRTAHTTSMILLIIFGATIFGYFFTLTQATQVAIEWVGSLGLRPWQVLVVILFGYIVLGCFMDQIAILILTVPLVLPIILDLGFDSVWFGVIVIVTAEVGLVTPPVGLNCFVVAKYSGRPLGEIFLGVMPHVVAHLIVIAAMVIWPNIVLWLPSTMR